MALSCIEIAKINQFTIYSTFDGDLEINQKPKESDIKLIESETMDYYWTQKTPDLEKVMVVSNHNILENFERTKGFFGEGNEKIIKTNFYLNLSECQKYAEHLVKLSKQRSQKGQIKLLLNVKIELNSKIKVDFGFINKNMIVSSIKWVSNLQEDYQEVTVIDEY